VLADQARVTAGPAGKLDLRAAARACVVPFTVAKLLTITVMVLAVWQHGTGAAIPGWSQLRDVFAYWDGQNYLQIAIQGYPPNANPTPGAPGHLWGFMPGYPLLIKGASIIFRDAILSGIVVSAVGEFVALVFLARLVAAERDERSARLAVWLLAFVPYGVFLTTVYTESAFLAFAAASLYYMRQGRFVAASVTGALATAIRVTGLALLPVIVLEYIVRRRGRLPLDVLAVVLVPLPVVVFCWYAAVHAGDALAYIHIQTSPSFHRQLASPWAGMTATLGQATSYIFGVEFGLGILGFLACVALWTWPWLGRFVVRAQRSTSMPWSFALFATLVWLSEIAQPYWLGLGRYEIGMLPVFILVADTVARSVQRSTAVIVASAGLMVYLTTLWSQGIFVA
jgi:hypothetical protein